MTHDFTSVKEVLTFLDALRDATGIRIGWAEGTTHADFPDGSPEAAFLAGWNARLDQAVKATACADCGGADFGYMVKNEVWKGGAGLAKGVVCWSCLEKRIGRPLVADDLKDVPLNGPIFKGIEIGKRC